jgi:hypothetical protein
MKKLWVIGASIVALSVGSALAEGDAGAPPVKKAKHEKPAAAADQPKPELKELTLTGTIQKIECKKKDGTVENVLKLVTTDGAEVMLPKTVKGKDGVPAVNLEELAGSNVRVVGMGYEQEKGGKRRCQLKEIKTVEKVGAPVAPAPAS